MSFTQTADGPSAPIVGAVVEGAGGALFVATGAGVHRTTDGGLNWSPLADPVVKAAGVLNGVLAAGGGKLYYAASADRGDGVYQSSDNGDHWIQFNTGLPLSGNGSIHVAGITADANNVYVLAFASSSNFPFQYQVFRSAHASAGFTAKHPLDGSMVSLGRASALAVAGANLCLLISGKGAYWSSNSGDHWTFSGGNGKQEALAVGPDGATVYLQSHYDTSAFKSADSCQSFSPQTTAGLPACGSSGYFPRSLGVDANGHVYHARTDPDPGNTCGIYKSTDGGAQYNADNDGLMATLAALGVQVTGFSRTSSGFFASTRGSGLLVDHAINGWTRLDSIKASTVIALASRGGPGRMIAASGGAIGAAAGSSTSGGGIFVTDDGGATWIPRNTGLSNRSPSALLVDGANLLTILGGTVWRSTNDGMQWNRSGMGGLQWGGELVKGPDGVYLKTMDTTNTVYKSVNGGQSWSNVTGNLPITYHQPASISADADRVYVILNGSTSRSGVRRDAGVWHTTTGTTWTQSANNGLAGGHLSRQVFPTGTSLLTVADVNSGPTLYRSTDNGDNWKPATGVAAQKFGLNDMRAFLKDASGALYIGLGAAGLFVSFDDGVSWTPDSDGLHPGKCIQSIESLATDGAKIYAAQGGAGVFTSNPAAAGEVGDSVACTPAGTNSGDTKTVSSGPGAGTTVSTNRGTIMNLSNTSTAPAGAPAGYSYPYGFFNFDITGLASGATVIVTLTLPEGAAPDIHIKCNASGSSCAPFAGAVFAGRVVTLTLVDGGAGDADGLVNGAISDPGASAVTQSSGGDGGNGSGAFGLGLLLLLLAAAGMRRRTHSSGSAAAR